MVIHWTWLLVAVAILAPPPLLSGHLRRVVTSVRRNAALGVVALLRPWQNWVDLVRSLVGTFLITNLAVVPVSLARVDTKVTMVQTVVLALCLIPQIVRFDPRANRPEQRINLLAPAFYLTGVTLGICGPLVGGFALVVGWALAFATKTPAYQLPGMAAATVAAGGVFGAGIAVAPSVLLALLPLMLAFGFRKRLGFVGSERRSLAAPARVATVA